MYLPIRLMSQLKVGPLLPIGSLVIWTKIFLLVGTVGELEFNLSFKWLNDMNPFFDKGLSVTKAASKLVNTLETLPE